jgi:DNA transformation protein and related proteins
MPTKLRNIQSEFVAFVIEQMSFIHGLRIRAMFGSHGIYQDDCMFAIIIEDQLYFKADATTREEFKTKGLSPFTYQARGKLVEVQYYEAPPEVFDEADEMRHWAHKALTVAVKAKKPRKNITS